MTDEAGRTMLMYAALKPEEESTLKSIDGDVWRTLLDNGINERAIWTTQSATEGRTIKLCIARESQTKTLFELPEEKVADLSKKEILSRLRDSLR
jgi:hypothetical protein